jgi:alcohol dehydrogenase class IV
MGTPKYFIWEYHTIVECGSGCRTFAPQRFMEMGSKRVGLLTDRGLIDAGVVDLVTDVFAAQTGGPVIGAVYDKIEQDASMSKINDCTHWYRENVLDGLLVVGGGSVMDSAKGVKFLLGTQGTDIRQALPGNGALLFRPLGRPLNVPSVFIPTTAGTGSEVSNVAVIYNEEERVKANLIHPYIMGEIALLDPELTLSLPPWMTAATGLDALGHAVEGMSSSEANCMSQSLNLQAIKLILKYLPIAVNDGKNMEARMKMLAASNMGIMGFSMGAMLAPGHNIAHAIGAKLRVPHGEAVAQVVPALMQFFPEYYVHCASELADAFGVAPTIKNPLEIIAAAREKIVELMQKCGFGTQFRVALDDNERASIVKAIQTDPSVQMTIPEPVLKNIVAAVFPSK